MRGVAWLAAIFLGSVVVGVVWWIAAALNTGASREYEGLLMLTGFVVIVTAPSSGILLLMIAPRELYEHFYRNRPPRNSNSATKP
jgi:hypothetical protein